ncbi:unnamed protein product [Ixodes persulcatus]
MASSPLVISAPTGWMPGDVLIDAVKKYPVLYDKRHERYKDNDFKEEIWKKIGSRFGVSGTHTLVSSALFRFCTLFCLHVVSLAFSGILLVLQAKETPARACFGSLRGQTLPSHTGCL